MVCWLFLWTLEFTDLRRGVKLGAPLRPCSLPVLLHFSTPHSLHLTWDTPVWGPQGQLDPNQEKGSLQSLMWIQATKVLNNCHVCSQPCTKGWNRIPRSLFSGKTEHQGRKGKHVERGQKHYLPQKEKNQESEGRDERVSKGLMSGQDSDIQQVTHLLKHQPDTATVGFTCGSSSFH